MSTPQLLEAVREGVAWRVYRGKMTSPTYRIVEVLVAKGPEHDDAVRRFAGVRSKGLPLVYQDGVLPDSGRRFASLEIPLGDFAYARLAEVMRRLGYVLHLCRGLLAAAAVGIRHGQVGPEWIGITTQHLRRRVTLRGFGEVADPDPRDDVLGLGRVLYMMLTGKDMPDAEARLAAEIIVPGGEDPFEFERYREVLCERINPILGRSLAADRAARHATVGEFHSDLRAARRSLWCRALRGSIRLEFERRYNPFYRQQEW